MTTKQKTSAKVKNSSITSNPNLVIAAVIVLTAVVGAVAVIFISSNSTGPAAAAVSYNDIPQERQPDGGFVLGDSEAPITVVAFEDFLCPHCQQYKDTVNEFIERYVATGQARFEYRMLPAVDPTFSVVAGNLATCAHEIRPGSFWQAHDVLFSLASSERFTSQTAQKFAEQMDMSYTELLDCFDGVDQVQTDTELARQLGVTGTPTVLVRVGDAPPQMTQFGQQPNIEQLGILVENAQAEG